ncbi:hypothetical protein TRFO_34143 [Tritrichomonas foetus]|uniref:Uncharacterized protein n=1 Tax=Tritrichomonas foetus TaxID=1144522 RepID=A0A1J4JJT2_9EUKA|nr:hypothetical protein TRFO_34143 [Tritrichomonas foetus]|eukprot:OHS99416.1 hypothetical protein TRFO_34143 [Tritrichomonas foetus]
MDVTYKGIPQSSSNQLNFLGRLHLLISSETEFDDPTIDQIKALFLNFLKLAPTQAIDEKLYAFFDSLNELINTTKYNKILPIIVPFDIYPQLTTFYYQTNDQFAHCTISRILVALTSDTTDALNELLKFSILDNILWNLQTIRFPNSVEYLIQIIGNYLDDSDEELSNIAKSKFPFSFFIQFLDFFKNSLLSQNENIIHRWISCVYIFFKETHSQEDAVKFLTAVEPLFLIIHRNSRSCSFLCHSIIRMIQSDTINYDIFNQFNYPTLITTLCFTDEVETKYSSLLLLYELIRSDRFIIQITIDDIFEIAYSDNLNNNYKIINATLYVCSAFFDNPNKALNAFNFVTNQIKPLHEMYSNSNFNIKNRIALLLALYVDFLSVKQITVDSELLVIIFNILNESIFGHDDETVTNILKALISFLVDYVKLNPNKIDLLNIFIQNIDVELIQELTDSENEIFAKSAELIISLVNDFNES